MQLCSLKHPEICYDTVLCPLCNEIDNNQGLKDELESYKIKIEELQYSIDITKGSLEIQAAAMSSLLRTIERVEKKTEHEEKLTQKVQELETQKRISQELAADSCAWGKDTCG